MAKRSADFEQFVQRLQGISETRLVELANLRECLEDSTTKISTLMDWYNEKQREVAHLTSQNSIISSANKKLVDIITTLHTEQGATLPLLTEDDLRDMLQPVVDSGSACLAIHENHDEEYLSFSAYLAKQLHAVQTIHRQLAAGKAQDSEDYGENVFSKRADVGDIISYVSYKSSDLGSSREGGSPGPAQPEDVKQDHPQEDDLEEQRNDYYFGVLERWMSREELLNPVDVVESDEEIDWLEAGQGDVEIAGDDAFEIQEEFLVLGHQHSDQEEDFAAASIGTHSAPGSIGRTVENSESSQGNYPLSSFQRAAGRSSTCCIIS